MAKTTEEKPYTYRCDTKEKADFCEQYGCMCCGNGFLHGTTLYWCVKMIDMINYIEKRTRNDKELLEREGYSVEKRSDGKI